MKLEVGCPAKHRKRSISPLGQDDMNAMLWLVEEQVSGAYLSSAQIHYTVAARVNNQTLLTSLVSN